MPYPGIQLKQAKSDHLKIGGYLMSLSLCEGFYSSLVSATNKVGEWRHREESLEAIEKVDFEHEHQCLFRSQIEVIQSKVRALSEDNSVLAKQKAICDKKLADSQSKWDMAMEKAELLERKILRCIEMKRGRSQVVLAGGGEVEEQARRRGQSESCESDYLDFRSRRAFFEKKSCIQQKVKVASSQKQHNEMEVRDLVVSEGDSEMVVWPRKNLEVTVCHTKVKKSLTVLFLEKDLFSLESSGDVRAKLALIGEELFLRMVPVACTCSRNEKEVRIQQICCLRCELEESIKAWGKCCKRHLSLLELLNKDRTRDRICRPEVKTSELKTTIQPWIAFSQVDPPFSSLTPERGSDSVQRAERVEAGAAVHEGNHLCAEKERCQKNAEAEPTEVTKDEVVSQSGEPVEPAADVEQDETNMDTEMPPLSGEVAVLYEKEKNVENRPRCGGDGLGAASDSDDLPQEIRHAAVIDELERKVQLQAVQLDHTGRLNIELSEENARLRSVARKMSKERYYIGGYLSERVGCEMEMARQLEQRTADCEACRAECENLRVQELRWKTMADSLNVELEEASKLLSSSAGQNQSKMLHRPGNGHLDKLEVSEKQFKTITLEHRMMADEIQRLKKQLSCRDALVGTYQARLEKSQKMSGAQAKTIQGLVQTLERHRKGSTADVCKPRDSRVRESGEFVPTSKVTRNSELPVTVLENNAAGSLPSSNHLQVDVRPKTRPLKSISNVNVAALKGQVHHPAINAKKLARADAPSKSHRTT